MSRIRIGLILLAFITMVLSASGAGVGAPVGPPQPAGAFVADEVLVKFARDVDPGPVARAVGARLHSRIEGLDVHVLKVPVGTVEATVRALTNNPLVEYAEPNGIATAFVDPNDPYDNTNCYNSSKNGCVTQWAWAKIQAYQAWDITTGSTAIRVAVTDTGVDNSHPDLPAVVAQKDFINNDNIAEDDNGHGTHVAGTIGALTNNSTGVAGTNWSVSLVAVKVLNASGSGSYSAISSGIRWAVDTGLAKVINISLGGYLPSSTLKSAVDYAWSKGVVLACAAGNDGRNWKLYPAAYANCIAVAATDENDNKASFSNYGSSWVDVAAPGVRILSTMPDSGGYYLCTQYGYCANSYDSLNGTSMATPHVAGLAALVWASRCSTASCVRGRIEQKADRIARTGTYWYWGRVNYYNSVKP